MTPGCNNSGREIGQLHQLWNPPVQPCGTRACKSMISRGRPEQLLWRPTSQNSHPDAPHDLHRLQADCDQALEPLRR